MSIFLSILSIAKSFFLSEDKIFATTAAPLKLTFTISQESMT